MSGPEVTMATEITSSNYSKSTAFTHGLSSPKGTLPSSLSYRLSSGLLRGRRIEGQ